ncbi:MAG: hypothetical protein U5J83_03065 [Bryobacterales bacterium]|nr:hypothetical protein [Bryobacterales bacterium]
MRISALVLLCLLALPLPAADALLELARSAPASAALRDAILARFDEKQLAAGTAFAGEGGEFLFALRAASAPALYIDDMRRGELARLPGADLWAGTASLATGTSHKFEYEVSGRRFGGRNDVPAYLPECYELPGVPQGTLTEKIVHRSSIYPGMSSDYWVYIPKQYNAATPAALMVWQDGPEPRQPQRQLSHAERSRQPHPSGPHPGDDPGLHLPRSGWRAADAQRRIRHDGQYLRALSSR